MWQGPGPMGSHYEAMPTNGAAAPSNGATAPCLAATGSNSWQLALHVTVCIFSEADVDWLKSQRARTARRAPTHINSHQEQTHTHTRARACRHMQHQETSHCVGILQMPTAGHAQTKQQTLKAIQWMHPFDTAADAAVVRAAVSVAADVASAAVPAAAVAVGEGRSALPTPRSE